MVVATVELRVSVAVVAGLMVTNLKFAVAINPMLDSVQLVAAIIGGFILLAAIVIIDPEIIANLVIVIHFILELVFAIVELRVAVAIVASLMAIDLKFAIAIYPMVESVQMVVAIIGFIHLAAIVIIGPEIIASLEVVIHYHLVFAIVDSDCSFLVVVVAIVVIVGLKVPVVADLIVIAKVAVGFHLRLSNLVICPDLN